MLSREQLLHLFDRFSTLTSQNDVKKRIADAVNDNQEAVAVTTAIQEEILKEMGVDPAYGLACLGKINMDYENDQDLMVRFYAFVAKERMEWCIPFETSFHLYMATKDNHGMEEMACEEAELGPDEYSERLQMQQNLHAHQLEMLKHMRNYGVDHQSAILEKLRQKMEKEEFENEGLVFSVDEMKEIVENGV